MNALTAMLASDAASVAGVVLPVVAALIALALAASFFRLGFLWLKAKLAGCYVPLVQLIGMRLRGVPPKTIVDAYIMTRKGGVEVSLRELETHHLARGNVLNVVRALVGARHADIEMSFNQACAADLAGRDVLEELRGVIALQRTTERGMGEDE